MEQFLSLLKSNRKYINCFMVFFSLVNCKSVDKSKSNVAAIDITNEIIQNKASFVTDISESEKQEIVVQHEKYRSEVNVRIPMLWSDEVAKVARRYAKILYDKKCERDPIYHSLHSDTVDDRLFYGEILDENIFESSAITKPAGVIDAFASEKKFYEFSTKKCQEGNICGHYENIINPQYIRVGCAKTDCLNNDGKFRAQVWTCNYSRFNDADRKSQKSTQVPTGNTAFEPQKNNCENFKFNPIEVNGKYKFQFLNIPADTQKINLYWGNSFLEAVKIPLNSSEYTTIEIWGFSKGSDLEFKPVLKNGSEGEGCRKVL